MNIFFIMFIQFCFQVWMSQSHNFRSYFILYWIFVVCSCSQFGGSLHYLWSYFWIWSIFVLCCCSRYCGLLFRSETVNNLIVLSKKLKIYSVDGFFFQFQVFCYWNICLWFWSRNICVCSFNSIFDSRYVYIFWINHPYYLVGFVIQKRYLFQSMQKSFTLLNAQFPQFIVCINEGTYLLNMIKILSFQNIMDGEGHL